ncbi:hypothetical protein [Nocardia sp. NPDC057353]|uniref:hypothetical protein n=1 Tax=Nocardia sp. NPDC057353 TaxID=3346104 RepID=UPI003626DE09
MSDRATEDEIMDEAKRFGQALAAAAHRHAVATTWLEKRLARKQVSRLMRAQHRDEQRTRTAQRKFANGAVDRYRQHSLGVAERAADPRTGAEQRTRDLAALGHHRRELQQWILTEPHLSETQRGIALDGIEAVTEFPQFKLGNLYTPGRRVMGMDALRYRAHVARVRAEHGMGRLQRGTTTAARTTSAVAAGPARRGQVAPLTVEQLDQQRPRPQAQHQAPAPAAAVPAAPAGADAPVPVAPGPQQLGLLQTEWVHKLRAAQMNWNTQAPATRDGNVLRNLDDQREYAAREAAEAGVSPERISHEMEYAAENSRFTSVLISYSEHGGYTTRGLHATEQEAVAWVNRVAAESNWRPGVSLRVSVAEHGADRPLYRAEGSVDRVRARTAGWVRTPDRGQQQRTTGASTGAGDELQELRTRHRLSIEHNADLAEQNARLTRQLTAVTADRDQLAAAAADRSGHEAAQELAEVRAERDRLRGERDEAVTKLARRTPPEQRYGSPQRQADAARGGDRARNGRGTNTGAASGVEGGLFGDGEVAAHYQAFREQMQAGIERERAAFPDQMREFAAGEHGKSLDSKTREWIATASDGELLAVGEQQGSVRRDPSKPPLNRVEESVKAVLGDTGTPDPGTDRDLPDSALADYEPTSLAEEMARGHQRNGMAR